MNNNDIIKNRFDIPQERFYTENIEKTLKNLKTIVSKFSKNIDLKSFSNYILTEKFDQFILFIWWSQIAWSLSPFMHTYSWYLDWKKVFYILLDISKKWKWNLSYILEEIQKRKNILWCNITMPYKIEAYKKLKNVWQLDDSALLVWAVNTIWKRNWEIIWFNTDIEGIILPIKNKNIDSRNAYIFWAWGAWMSAIAGCLLLWVKNIFVFNRSEEKLEKIKEHFYSEDVKKLLEKKWIDWYKINCLKYDVKINETLVSNIIKEKWIIINTLPFWFKNELPKMPISKEQLLKIIPKIELLFDVVYDINYEITPILSSVLQKGIPVINWKEMVIYQAKKWFELWTWKNFNEENFLSLLN